MIGSMNIGLIIVRMIIDFRIWEEMAHLRHCMLTFIGTKKVGAVYICMINQTCTLDHIHGQATYVALRSGRYSHRDRRIASKTS